MKPKIFFIGFFVTSLVLGLIPVGFAQGSLETITSPDGTTVGSIDWSAAGKIEATGFGIGAANASVEAQKKVTARRAAIADAQRQLLEIIQGVSLYNGVLTSDRMLANDTVVTQVQGVLRGAVIVEGSEKWDGEAGLYELTMTIALADLRDAVEPTDMEASLDIENLILLGSSVTQTPAETSEPAQTSDTAATEPASTPAPAPPSVAANNDNFETTQGGTLAESVLTNDAAISPGAQVALLGNVAHGSLTLNPDGTFTYTHDGSGNATDIFKYSVSDGTTTAEAFATISVALAQANTTPASSTPEPNTPNTPATNATVAAPDTYTVNQGGTLEIDASKGVLANDSSPTGSTLLVISNGSPSHGILTLYVEDGSFKYSHDGSSSTADTFVYTANDGSGNSNETTVTINITPGIQTQSAPAKSTGASQTIPQTSTQAPVLQGETAVSAPASPSATPSTVSTSVGGGEPEEPALPPAGELPTGIILDASSSSIKKSFFINIFDSSGATLAERVRATYFNESLEEAKQQPDVAASPEVMPVFALSSNNVDVVLSDQAAGRFKSLLAAKEFHILILQQK